jgi:tRNA threonylcarbamoyl adenosine modification protein YeaZ
VRTLAIDCATEACSAALFDGNSFLDGRFEILGRGHAERLVPMIAELPGKGRAERVVVSLGPGSFTGVRIGLAAARALGLAWGAEVLGYPTLALVAAMAREEHPGPVTVCMIGGHGQWFVQDFAADGQPEHPLLSQVPTDARQSPHYRVAAGTRARELIEGAGAENYALDILPDARKFLLLPPALLDSDLTPIYGRAPDARLPEALG